MKEGTQMEEVSVCDLIPEFMSFVSLDCTYTGRNMDHSGTQSLFIFYFYCLFVFIFLYIYIQYILTNLMLMRFSAKEQLVCLFTVYMWKCDFSNIFVFSVATTTAFPVTFFFFLNVGRLT